MLVDLKGRLERQFQFPIFINKNFSPLCFQQFIVQFYIEVNIISPTSALWALPVPLFRTLHHLEENHKAEAIEMGTLECSSRETNISIREHAKCLEFSTLECELLASFIFVLVQNQLLVNVWCSDFVFHDLEIQLLLRNKPHDCKAKDVSNVIF